MPKQPSCFGVSASFFVLCYLGNIAMRYCRDHDKSALRSGAHGWAPCAHRNLGFRYAMPTFVLMCTSKRQAMPRPALYDAVQIAARKETLEIGCACFCNDRARFSSGPGDVRRDVEVLKADEWVALARRFAV